jgi:hypothetical protein
MSKYEAGTFDDIRMRTLLKIIDGLIIPNLPGPASASAG